MFCSIVPNKVLQLFLLFFLSGLSIAHSQNDQVSTHFHSLPSKSFNSCIKKIKNKMITQSLFLIPIESNFDHVNMDQSSFLGRDHNQKINDLNELFRKKHFEKTFAAIYSSHLESKPYEIDLLFNQVKDENGDLFFDELSYEYSLKYIIPDGKKEYELLFSITALIKQSGHSFKPSYKIEQNFIADNNENCTLHPNDLSIAEFTPLKDDPAMLEVKLSSFDLVSKKMVEENSKRISKKSLFLYNNQMLNFEFLSKNDEFDLFSTEIFDFLNFKKQSINQKIDFDPLKNASVLFDQIDIELSFNNKLIFIVSKFFSSMSSYSYSKNTKNQEISRKLNQDFWIRDELIAKDENSKTVIGFIDEDFDKSLLTYRISTSNPLRNYESISSYGELDRISFENGLHTYQFKSMDFSKLPESNLSENLEKNLFLKETEFYDFSHPRVQLVIQDLKKLGIEDRNKSILDKVALIVQVIRESITTDDHIMNGNKFNAALKASEILEIKKGVCAHYSNLFVTFARAFDIPARGIIGWIVENKDIHRHGWIEILDEKNRWLPIEPQSGFFVKRNYIPHSYSGIDEAKIGVSNEELHVINGKIKNSFLIYDLIVEKIDE